MNMTIATAMSLGIASLIAIPGCQGSGSFAKVQESLAQIGDKQDQILARLDQVESKVGKAAPTRPPQAQPRPGRPDPKLTYKVPVSPNDAVKGSPTAKVTIVEWSDFQCPFCSRVTPTIQEITKAYGDDVRIVFKHNALPMHNRALAAAIAAEAAGRQGKFWEMHDQMFANQRALTDDNFEAWANELGLDIETFKKDLRDPALAKKAQADQKLGSTLGARGTPAFFVNGRFLSGAQPFDAFKALIDEEMKKADKLLASGVPRDQLYDKTIARGKPKV